MLAMTAGLLLAADEPPPPPTAVDHLGDSLPPGAIARLGTARLVHIGHLHAVACSPDGKIVASGAFSFGSYERTSIRLWDTANGKLIRTIAVSDGPILALHFAPTGTMLYAGCDTHVCCFDTTTGRALWKSAAFDRREFDRGGSAHTLLRLDDILVSIHGGSALCSITRGDTVEHHDHPQQFLRFWDAKSGKPRPLAPEFKATINSEFPIPALFHEIVIAPDGRHAALVVSRAELPAPTDDFLRERRWNYVDTQIRIVDLKRLEVVRKIAFGKVIPKHVVFANDGLSVAYAAESQIWRLQLASGAKDAVAQNFPQALKELKFIADNRLAAMTLEESVVVWDLMTRRQIKDHAVHPVDFENSSRGPLAMSFIGNTLRLIDRATGQLKPVLEGHREATAVRFSLGAKNTLITRRSQHAMLWDTSTWTLRGTLNAPDDERFDWSLTSGLRTTMNQNISCETKLYINEGKNSVELREIGSERRIRKMPKNAFEFKFSNAGNRLLVQKPNRFEFYDASSGRYLSKIPHEDPFRFSLRFSLSQSGRYFVKNEDHQRIELFDVSTGKRIRSFRPSFPDHAKNGSVLQAQISDDERFVLGEVREFNKHLENGYFGEKALVALWDVTNGELVREIAIIPDIRVFWQEGLNRSDLHNLTLSPDGRLIALSQRDQSTLQIWEVASGTMRGELRGHEGPIADLAFSADGRWLASSSEDTTILIWDMTRPLQPVARKERLTDVGLAAHWETLQQPDAANADAAIGSLVAAAHESVPFLRTKLRPISAPDGKRVRQWLDDLGSENFQMRSRAYGELERFGETVLGELENALKSDPPLEKRKRLEALTRGARAIALPFNTPQRLREWRALETLERIGNPEALALVRELASGAAGARLTKSARAVVERVDARAE